MDQPFIDKQKKVEALKSEISFLNQKIKELEAEVNSIQRQCNHQFQENAFMRKCIKCHHAESLHY
ncbi:prefoldin subunit 5 [Oikeobacillus pervagus]|uniref:Prefoldin subunit 5 n=1 Tax=Oikeobacillus pervagus TaxID=1325931 RepID=A0AAJ1T1L7_9BACI|nr:hypothetical protein [Oikeobacillus pervagus]MDQ0216704.1 prefoldin subunit 5 [Oikeobacillus pervagus]